MRGQTRPVRIGTLGAARITPAALIRPARRVDDVDVLAVAARDPDRARAFARRHDIPQVHATYEALVEDPAIDAVYVPLPNSLHAPWTLRALAAGKHVLCEKPFASNAAEAADVAAAAGASDRIVMEAFHWRFHPLAARVLDVIGSGSLGAIRHVEATMCLPLPFLGDIRYQYGLAGGAMMDVGAYTAHIVRTFAGAEPTVEAATARTVRPDVDRWIRADLRFPDGATGRMTCALLSARLLQISARIVGAEGEVRVLDPVAPHVFNVLTIRTPAGVTHQRVRGESTYTCQLRAFADAVLRGGPVLTPPPESVATMRLIDAVYEKAGLPRRGGR